MRALRLTLFVALALCSSAGAQVYPIYELPTEDLPNLHDGSLEDWEDVLPGTSLTLDDFAPLAVGDHDSGPGDLLYRVYMAWNSADQRIYTGIERVDDLYVNTYEGGDPQMMWQHDGAELMLDGDHSGGDYNWYEAEDVGGEEQLKLLAGRQAQHYYLIAGSPDGLPIGVESAASGWADRPPWAEAGGGAVGQGPTTSGIEAAVTPWDALDWHGPEQSQRSRLEAGRIIGFLMPAGSPAPNAALAGR